MDAGFYLKEDDLKEIIEAHNSYSYPYYRTKDDEYLETIFIYNTSNMDSKVKNGIVGGLTINNCSDMDFTVVGGLTFGSLIIFRKNPGSTVRAFLCLKFYKY